MYPVRPKTTKRFHNLKLDIDIPIVLKTRVATPSSNTTKEKDLEENTDAARMNVNCKLVETAIKFFLFQRGQVPIPYERITRRDKEEFCKMPATDLMVMEDENLSTKERLKLIRVKRKENFEKRKRSLKLRRIIDKENSILHVWEPVFKILRSVSFSSDIISPNSSSEAIILMFGSSFLNPKEIIIVEYVNDRSNEDARSKPEETEDLLAMTRSFYKSLIMSSEFIDFTEKRLQRTYSHILYLTKRSLSHDIIERENIVRLEDHDTSFLKSIANPERKSREQLLHLRLNFSDSSDNITNSIFSLSDIVSYQLPLRYKGISIL